MFEDLLGKDKRYVETVKWILNINDEEHEVEVYNVEENDKGSMEGYIKDKEHKIDMYTNYVITMPKMPNRPIKVIIIRVNEYTLKFYVPEVK
jgi:hypothetical protein